VSAGPIHATFPSAGDVMPGVNELVDRIGDAYSVPLETLTNLRIALDEIVTNIVSYAYPDGASHEIRIQCEMRGGHLETTVEDDGLAYDPLQAPAPDVTSSLTRRPVGGLGVHFVKSLMHAVVYERVAGHNRLTLQQVIETNGSDA
jgi:anti-sigma regulatory factor (Ser/Thr protein kinase)